MAAVLRAVGVNAELDWRSLAVVAAKRDDETVIDMPQVAFTLRLGGEQLLANIQSFAEQHSLDSV